MDIFCFFLLTDWDIGDSLFIQYKRFERIIQEKDMIKKQILIAALVSACVLGLNSAWAGGSRQGAGSTPGGTMQLTK
jgi:hypothetical protein